MQGLREQIDAAVQEIRRKSSLVPQVGMILGTGLGGLSEQIEQRTAVPYEVIPHFPRSTVESHTGQLVFGELGGAPVVVMEGRIHYYEGYSLREVTFPVRVMKALGADILLTTSAVGGLNPQYELADIVLLEDHINFLPDNPLRGINDETLGPRFPDMSQPYDRRLLELARQQALQLAIPAHAGVLVAVPGPNLETRAEYRMLRGFGADVVGMSTVPEVIVAAHAGLRALGFSVITDMCLPDALEPVELPKILAVAAEGGEKLSRLIPAVLKNLPAANPDDG